MQIIRNELKVTIPVIALTAEADNETLQDILAAGANSFIRKPARIEDILSALGQYGIRP